MSRVLRGIALLALLVWLGSVLDVHAALALLGGVDWRWIVAGLVLVQLQVVLSALRWRLTARALGRDIGTGRAVAEYFLATLVNQTLPGGMAGDAFRVVRNRDAGGAALVGQSVVVERLAGQVALFAVTLAGFIAWPWLLDGPVPRAGIVMLVLLACIATGAALALSLLVRSSTPRIPRRLTEFLAGIAPALRRAWIDDGAAWTQVPLGLAIVASYLGLFGIAAAGIGAPLPLAGLVTVVPLALLAMLLPVSVGGWGLREAAAATLWPLVGLAGEAGLATSVLYGLLSLAGSLPGLVVPLLDGRRAKAHRAQPGA